MEPDAAAHEVGLEQEAVSGMYALLDERLAAARADLAEVLRSPVRGAAATHTREVTAAGLARQVTRLEGAQSALCFGRLDRADGSALHVGRVGLRTDDADLPLLVDWRADAARPFYAATPVEPMGLRRRRHLRVEDRTVRGVSDEILDGSPPGASDVVGDGPLTEALRARRTGRMGQVVATLQAEQDAIVRSPDRGVTVVQGGPGTGKTVVALHRAAYVLYAFTRAAEDGVLVVGPNTRFLDYISQVLPSLGENDVVLATTADLTGRTASASDPTDVARLKGRAELAEGLAALVRSRQASHDEFAVRVGQEEVRLSPGTVAEARVRARSSEPAHNAAREVFKEHLVDALTDELERRAYDDLERIDAEVAQLTSIDLDRVAASDLAALGYDGGGAGDLSADFDPDAVRDELGQDPLVDRTVDALWPRLLPDDVVRRLLGSSVALAAFLPGLTAQDRALLLRAPDAPWTDADLPLLDEAAALVDGPPERVFGHVVVDEAQELTGLEWRAVVRRCPARSMTVVGDFAQAGPLTVARDWAGALGPHLGEGRFRIATLTVSYRTTAEILGATRDLLARIAPGQAMSRAVRHGEAPRTAAVGPDGLVATLVAEVRSDGSAHPGELVGVVCPDALAADVAAGLAGTGARVVPASEARGLEFDAVLVVGPDEIAAARVGGERDLYVALTRATKRLVTVPL